ncbi:MAG: hypothetical protein R3204_12770, partial [Oceanospirillum sp.]|nr:hypothetical protein [Oceanospirillum sp.]
MITRIKQFSPFKWLYSAKQVLAAILMISGLSVFSPVSAAQFVFDDLRVEGLQRVSASRVFSAFPIELRKQVSNQDLV